MTQATTNFDTIATVIVAVSDQDRALDFYRGTLGFEQVSDIPYGEGNRWVEVATPSGGTRIALALPMNGWAGGVMTGISFNTADIDAAHAQLREHGADVDAEVMRMGTPVPPMFFFRDQDGNTLLVVQGD